MGSSTWAASRRRTGRSPRCWGRRAAWCSRSRCSHPGCPPPPCTMAGQVIMQGFIHRQVSVWVRRLVTMTPALAAIALGLDPTRTLVISQVVLSFGLPFALVPLVLFTRRRDLMGELTNDPLTTIASAFATALIVALNVFLLVQVLSGRG